MENNLPEHENFSSKNELELFESIDKNKVKSQIYEIRGIRVMLDRDIAAYFGVTTGNLNKAMKRNIKRFPPKFCFMLTKEEYREILRFQTGILELEQGKYSKYLPYVYTEHGLSMLTSVLHTDRAIEASILIMEVFVEVAHYVRQNAQLIPYQELKLLQSRQDLLSEKIQGIEDSMVTKTDVIKIIEDFSNNEIKKDFLFLNGKVVEADLAYQQIYAEAKETIFVIDNYIGLKTLVLLKSAKKDVKITIFSDNIHHGLHKKELDDFTKEYPHIVISFKKTDGIFHDRYIMLDFDTENEKIYHCGASSKDAGNKVCSISSTADHNMYKPLIENLLTNPKLVL
ncbi:ORF6N domain-containing protein [bacterium]|nr:ORF6N domain-containing protein [bacterium]